MSEPRDTLKKSPLFSDVDDDVVERFAGMAEIRTYSAGDIIFAEFAPGEEIFLILEGKVDIQFALANADQNFEIVTLSAGALLGEVCFVDDGPRSASAIAKTNTKVLAWKCAQWRQICESDPATGYKVVLGIARTLSERLRRWNVRMLNDVSWGLE